jgi:uncharacterized protein (TIGR01777 family)
LPNFTKRTHIPVPASALFDWHKRPGAFERLNPPWDRVEVVERSGGIESGARVTLRVPVGPLVRTRWVIEHQDYVEGRQFRDVQLEGPFARWVHTHRTDPDGPDASTLDDSIDYTLPLGPLGALFGAPIARAKLRRLFQHRHAVTTADLERHRQFAERGTLRIAITGSHGLIGSTLVPFLTTGGHEVRRLVRAGGRRDAHAGGQGATGGDILWDPQRMQLDPAELEGLDAVIHLAGETVAERWTGEHKRAIRESRVNGTTLLARAIAGLSDPPKVLISASAVGYYGDGGDRLLDESAPPGRDFLAGVAQAWEEAAQPAAARGVRVVHPRFGVVLSPAGGALARLLPAFKLYGGGRLGSGRQWMSWVALDDVVGALHHLLFSESVAGPVNVVAPNPVTNEEFGRTLGRVLDRPAKVAVPAFVIRAMFGEMAETMLLAGQRLAPRQLLESGFRFRHPVLEEALRFELGRG